MLGQSQVEESVRRHCEWCSRVSRIKLEVELCPAAECPLHQCRYGAGATKKAVAAKCIDCRPDDYRKCDLSCDLLRVNMACRDFMWTKTRSCIDGRKAKTEADDQGGAEALPGQRTSVS